MSEFTERVRAFEHRLQAHMGEIFCPVHLSLGHEGIADDLHRLLTPQDWLFSTHRNHHHYFAKGGTEEKLWDEIMGAPSGLNGGFAGSQSISDDVLHFHASAIVGGLVGTATGTALALQLDSSNAIVVCCVGDAGTKQGVFWESLNFAVLHCLPIAYIVENNGMSVDARLGERQFAGISGRVAAFGLSVRDTVDGALECARMGLPAFHEAQVTLECNHIDMASMLKK